MTLPYERLNEALENYTGWLGSYSADQSIAKFLLPLELIETRSLPDDVMPIPVKWFEQASLLRNPESFKWLQAVGGLPLLNVDNETDLLFMAHTAPNDLLFGLAYGIYADMLAWNDSEWEEMNGIRSDAQNALRIDIGKRVLRRGNDLWKQTQWRWNEGKYFEEMEEIGGFDKEISPPYSKTPISTLCNVTASLSFEMPFALGMVTSWLFLAQNYRFPDTRKAKKEYVHHTWIE